MDVLAKTSDGSYYEIGVCEQDESSSSAANSILGKRMNSESRMKSPRDKQLNTRQDLQSKKFVARGLKADTMRSGTSKSLLEIYVENSMLNTGIHVIPTAGFNLLKVIIDLYMIYIYVCVYINKKK